MDFDIHGVLLLVWLCNGLSTSFVLNAVVFKFYEPENITLTIPLDGHGNINCSAEKPGDVLYSMTKMGSCQNLANTGIHTIQKASFSDAGTYVCKLISDGEVKTKFITVNVTATGHYMYFEASGGSQHDTAVLKSHMLSTGPYCLSMAYNMNGYSIGALNVYTKECNSTARHKIWSAAGNKGEHWFDACIKTPVLSRDYQIYIEAERGSTYARYIAIDDVNIHAGNCICSSKTVVQHHTQELRCGDHVCHDSQRCLIEMRNVTYLHLRCHNHIDHDIPCSPNSLRSKHRCFCDTRTCVDHTLISLVSGHQVTGLICSNDDSHVCHARQVCQIFHDNNGQLRKHCVDPTHLISHLHECRHLLNEQCYCTTQECVFGQFTATNDACSDDEDANFSCAVYEMMYSLCTATTGTLYRIAHKRCQRFCGICSGNSILGPQPNSLPTQQTCIDHDVRCTQYQANICSSSVSQSYVISTCAKTCNKCAEYYASLQNPTTTTAKPVTTPAKPVKTTAKPVTTTAQPATTTAKPVTNAAKPITTTSKPITTTAVVCQDKPGVDCKLFNIDFCANPYSNTICAKSCGHCTKVIQSAFG